MRVRESDIALALHDITHLQNGDPALTRPSQASARSRLTAEAAGALTRIAALTSDFDAIVTARQAGADDEHDPDAAATAFERQHLAALIAGARARLAAIEAALGRLDAGTYGRCTGCGQPVGTERLSARPDAAACIRCARGSGPASSPASGRSRP